MLKHWKELTWRLLPGTLAAVIVGGLAQVGLLQPVNYLAYNGLFQLRGARDWDDRVVIIAIDDRSIQDLGRYPWPRRYFTQLMQRLNQAEPSVVAFDLIFSERSADDADLVSAMAQQGRVVLAQAIDLHGLPLMPVKPLQEAAVGVGHIFHRVDSDGVTRSLPLEFGGQPALSWAAVQTYGLVHPIPSMDNPPKQLWLNWVGSVRTLRQYSFSDVLHHRVPNAALNNKILFVGITATGFDTVLTPFNHNALETSGVYLHATAAHNLLQQEDLHPFNPIWLNWLFLAMMPGLGWLLSDLRTEWQVVCILSLSGLIAGSAVLLLRLNYWLPVVLPMSLVITTGAALMLTDQLRMNHLLQTQVRYLWQTYPIAPLPLDAAVEPPQATDRSTKNRQLRIALPSSLPASSRVVTQLTDLAEQLGRARATQLAIAQSLSAGILAADQAGRVWFANPTASQWLPVQVGDQLSEGLGQGWLSSEDWQRVSIQVLSPNPPTQALPLDWEVLHDDRWFWLKFVPLTLAASDRSHPPAGHLVLLMEDITSRKQIAENLAKQNQELQRIAQLKDNFINTISQELQSPLTKILGAIETIKTAPNAAEKLNCIQQIKSECLREQNLINDLLSLQAAVETPQPDHSAQWINLNTWLPELIAPFQARASTRQQVIELALDEALSPIQTNRLALERVLKELLTNACKYTPAWQRICVKAAQNPTDTEIAVQNFGVEIPPEELPRIFEKFYRIPHTDPWKQGGTGLGLALVQRLSEEMGATIAVVSHNGYTQFSLRLPRA
jgi:CHASE2 domain-containing sensor protein/signal transduction histidine kinase